MPNIGLNKATAGLAGATGAAAATMGPAALAVAVPGAIASSPRAVGRLAQKLDGASAKAAKVLPYAQRFGDMIKSLPPEQMKALLKNENLLNATVREVFVSSQKEDQDTETLLREAGLK
jgi:hypothetical protein